MAPPPAWTHRRFFDLLRGLGTLRVISVSGPSVFEALCEFGPYGFAQGHMNAMTEAYHWHLGLSGFGHVQSRDQIHGRSGRRVLFFELRGEAAEAPFLRIYVHRAKDAEFDAAFEKRFLEAHAELAEGAAIASEPEGESA